MTQFTRLFSNRERLRETLALFSIGLSKSCVPHFLHFRTIFCRSQTGSSIYRVRWAIAWFFFYREGTLCTHLAKPWPISAESCCFCALVYINRSGNIASIYVRKLVRIMEWINLAKSLRVFAIWPESIPGIISSFVINLTTIGIGVIRCVNRLIPSWILVWNIP